MGIGSIKKKIIIELGELNQKVSIKKWEPMHILENNYLCQLKDFIQNEQNTQNQEVLEGWMQPIEKRIEDGIAINELEIVQRTYNEITLSFHQNISKFRRGDYLRLSKNEPSDGDKSYKCLLLEEGLNELHIKAGYGETFQNFDQNHGWTLDQDLVDLRHIQLGILGEISGESVLKSYFHQFLSGDLQPSINSKFKEHANLYAKNLGFNKSQLDAFTNAFATENYYLIQGPPGTGKTWLLAYLATALAQIGQRVLVTAFTHRAINNALLTIAETTKYNKVLKIGQTNRIDGLSSDKGKVENFEFFDRSDYSYDEKGIIVGGTCYAVRSKRLKEMSFDTVIFDEAGQMTIPLAFAGMLAGKRSIFIGDHQQMPPVITTSHEPEWVSKSIFELLYQNHPGTMLDITYRMNKEINSFRSAAFYQHKLRPHQENANRRLPLKKKPSHFPIILDPEYPDIFVEIKHRGRGMRSPEEATVALQIILDAIDCGLPATQIAVIAPYRAQGRLIRKLLHEQEDLIPDLSQDIIVDTVERIQGQQKELIIISLTTSNPEHAANRAEFFFQPNRLNVAITRPKSKRIILGSPLLFEAKPKNRIHQKNIELFRDLYKESTKVTLHQW